jgi:hypothetical protein
VPAIWDLFENDGPGEPPYEPPTHKQCLRCQRWLPIDAFHRNRFFKDGRQLNCSDCGRDAARDYYRQNAERLRPKARERMRRLAAQRKAARASTTTWPRKQMNDHHHERQHPAANFEAVSKAPRTTPGRRLGLRRSSANSRGNA